MIYIFATSVQNEEDIEKLRPYLEKAIPDAIWSFDLEDCDNIFRVDSSIVNADSIVRLLFKAGYHCEELPYELA